VSLTRVQLLKRAAALVVVSRVRWVQTAFAATPSAIDALVAFVVPEQKLRPVAASRLIRTLDRFLPGPQPLSATAAAILDGAAAQVRAGATFAKLSRGEQVRVFATLERLPNESAGSIRFLVGNLPGLTAFVGYSTRRRLRHGYKDFKGYWRG
jgi:hypothetical protein